MKVEDNNFMTFENLKPGEVFIVRYDHYMKIKDYKDYNCVNINYNYLSHFRPEELVRVVKVKIVVEN